MRRTGLVLALPILLPLLGVAFARADDAPGKPAPDEPKPDAPKPDAPKPDAPKPDAPKPEAKPGDESKNGATGITWLHDFAEAKAKATELKKGLFVYLTPTWFVCGFCKKLEAAGYSDAEVQKFVGDRFVAVRIDDKSDDFFAAKLGLSQVGYPNIAVYDAEHEYLGRVVGFGGKDPWFKQLQETWAVSEKLSGAKAAATKDPAAWAAFAGLVSEIPDREKDALAALERVPEAGRSTEYAATRAAFAAKLAWTDVEKALRATAKLTKSPEDAKKAAPAGLELIETWLKDHGGANAKAAPAAWARKGGLLVLLDRKAEAVAVATKILTDWPESPQAQALLRGLR